jgi:RNA recognition motif-containing protein
LNPIETMTDPIFIGIASGVAGFLAGVLVSKCAGGSGISMCHSSSGDCVELYVGNLSYDMTEAQMRKEFERYGKVKSARIITHRFNHRSKGFGFVEMPIRSEAEAAIKATNGKDFLNRKLRVNEAKNKSRD